MTCDLCFEGRHWKCRGCGCNICAAPEARRVKSAKKPRAKQEGPRGPRSYVYVSPLGAKAVERRRRIGVLTSLSDEEVQRIFAAKAQGITISELGRELNTTRDRVRTVYNCPAAPPLGPRLVPRIQPKEPCPTCNQMWRPPIERDEAATLSPSH